MNLTVFGASRNTGHHVLAQALAAGHQVTAVIRQPSAITIEHPSLRVLQGDVLKPETITTAFSGSDAVISTLGTRDRKPTTLYSEGTTNIIAAMVQAGVRRLICLSASGLDPGPRWQRWLAKPILWMVFRDGYTDMTRMEAAVRASDRDWTIVRPPYLTDGPRTDQVHLAIGEHLTRGRQISRADLAACLLSLVDRADAVRQIVEVAQ